MKYRLAIPAGMFGAVYADPPWMLRTGGVMRKLHHDTMTTEEIMEMGQQLTAPGVLRPDAHLWLWTTNPHLPEALNVLQSWSFTYKTMMTWDKDRIGIGWWLRSRTEHILFGVRDSNIQSYRIQPGGISTLLKAPYRGHSVKPVEVYDIIERLSPGPYLELFASTQRPGWTALTSSMPAAGDPYGTGYRMDGKCPDCPHDYHPTRVCDMYAPPLDRLCPCGYDVEEEGQDMLGGPTYKGIRPSEMLRAVKVS